MSLVLVLDLKPWLNFLILYANLHKFDLILHNENSKLTCGSNVQVVAIAVGHSYGGEVEPVCIDDEHIRGRHNGHLHRNVAIECEVATWIHQSSF